MKGKVVKPLSVKIKICFWIFNNILIQVKENPYIEDVEGNGENGESDSIQTWHNYLLPDKSVIADVFQYQ